MESSSAFFVQRTRHQVNREISVKLTLQYSAQSGYALASIFGFFLFIYNFLQFAIDWKNNSKTKVEKVFFFIFMSSCAEMSFFK
jgi:hypothetical protein